MSALERAEPVEPGRVDNEPQPHRGRDWCHWCGRVVAGRLVGSFFCPYCKADQRRGGFEAAYQGTT